MGRKHDQKFMELLAKHGRLDEATGNIRFEGMYASVHIDIGWNGTVVSVPHSHVVWFLKYGRWPRDGYQLDHIDDDPMNNAPENLTEVTHAENQNKRRGRIVSRAYGKGKYGYGINIHGDKRDGRFYVTRFLSRGHGDGDLKTTRHPLGGFDTMAEAQAKVRSVIEQIKVHGLDYIPPRDAKKEKAASIALMAATQSMRRMRAAGKTYQAIADETGFPIASVYKKTRDVKVE